MGLFGDSKSTTNIDASTANATGQIDLSGASNSFAVNVSPALSKSTGVFDVKTWYAPSSISIAEGTDAINASAQIIRAQTGQQPTIIETIANWLNISTTAAKWVFWGALGLGAAFLVKGVTRG